MDLLSLIFIYVLFGYPFWIYIIINFIINDSDFNDKQSDTFLGCIFYVPLPAFVCLMVFNIIMFGVEWDEREEALVFIITVLLTYMSPLFVYQIIQWFNQIVEFIKKIVEFIKNNREHRHLVKEREKLSDTSKQEELGV